MLDIARCASCSMCWEAIVSCQRMASRASYSGKKLQNNAKRKLQFLTLRFLTAAERKELETMNIRSALATAKGRIYGERVAAALLP